ASELVTSVADAGECEFISQVSQRYPTEIFLNLMGLEKEKRETFVGWVDKAVRAADPAEARSAYDKVKAVLTEALDIKRKEPKDDLLSQLLVKTLNDRPLTNDEILGISVTLFIGGLDTVVTLLAFIMQHLAE